MTVSDFTYTAYASASDVAMLCRNLLGPEHAFSQSSSPSLLSVNTWLSSGCSIIESKIAGAGYAVPIVQGTTLYQWLSDLNAMFAVSRAEMSRINVTLNSGERTRGQLFEEMFWKQLDTLVTSIDLTTIGGVTNSSGNSILGQTMWVGGTSVASKDTYKDDTDRVKPKFSVGMFNLPGTLDHNSAEYNTDD